MPNSTLASDNVDYVYVGRASGNIIHFATAIYEGTDVTSIPDILSKNDVSTDQKYTIQDYKIDYTNFPRIPWEDFDFSYLLTSNKTFNYFTSTGCTGSCTFCSWGGKHPWSRIPTNYVLDDIQYLVSKYNLSFIWFADSTFTANKNTNLEIAQGIIDRKIDIAWRCHSRVLELNKFNKEDLYF